MEYLDRYMISAKNDVVNRDEEQFNYISNSSHNSKTNSTWCSNLQEFWIDIVLPFLSGLSHLLRNLSLSTANCLALWAKFFKSYMDLNIIINIWYVYNINQLLLIDINLCIRLFYYFTIYINILIFKFTRVIKYNTTYFIIRSNIINI